MKKTIYLLGVILLVSCNYTPSNKISLEQTIEATQDSPFNNEALPVALSKVFTTPLSTKTLAEYNANLQKYLEHEYDGKEFSFKSTDKSLKVKFQLNESFKMTEQKHILQGIFSTCRIYE